MAKWGCEMTRDPGPQCDSMRIASDYAPDVWWAGLLPPNFHLNGELNVHTATLMFSACAMMYYAAMERAMDHG